ncbi:MAG TPA: four helix bundle protein [Planctomycetota bacterium]|nr:four helix bundle protein [Planctomycetota bacterium]
MQDFKKLKFWQKSHALLLDVYAVAAGFPKEEMYGINRQLKDAALSVETNIAEGSGKASSQEFKRFVSISMGSTCEVESLLIAARDLKFLPSAAFDRVSSLCTEVRRMLYSFHRALSVSSSRPPPRPPKT